MHPISTVLAAVFFWAWPAQAPPEAPKTAAERSDYRATARYDEVQAFIHQLAEQSELVRVGSLGKSVEGRSIPLVILSDPPVETAEQAVESGKLVVLAFGGIHAGEICGKEALLALGRDLALNAEDESNRAILKELVVVLAPIFNVDGNERVSKDNRPGQVGPAEGMGQRHNAHDLDLNRDWVKLDTPEVRSFVRFLNKWDPALIIDTHTTNGSYHRYTLTYAGPRLPAGDADVLKFVRDDLLPAVAARVKAQTGYETFPYGNFNADGTRWTTYPPLPRYGTPYRGLRNRLAVLTEGYAYASFKDRVLCTKSFVRNCLTEVAGRAGEVRTLLEDADRRAVEKGDHPKPDDLVPIRCEIAPFDEPVTVAGFEKLHPKRNRDYTLKNGTHDRGAEKDRVVAFWGRSKPTLSVRRPFAYLFPARYRSAVEKLLRHGVKVEQLREDVELDVEVYSVTGIERSDRTYQGHRTVDVAVSARKESRSFGHGTIIVRTAQKLGALVVTLLEPASQDGLCTWNEFDGALAVGADFPVVRLLDPTPPTRRPVRPLPEDWPTGKRLSFDELYRADSPPALAGHPVRGLIWMPDGGHYLQVKDDALFLVDAVTGRMTPFLDVEKVSRALAALPTIDQKTADKIAKRTRFNMNESRTAALINHDNDLYLLPFDGGEVVRLTSTPGRERLERFSPDGRFVVFVRDYDLHVVDLATRTERALTVGGDDRMRNGILDWVYFEELYSRNWKGFWISPDSMHIAFLQVDDRALAEFTVIDEIPLHQKVERTAYPKSGDPIPSVRLGVVSVGGGDVRWVDLADYLPGSFLVPRVCWAPDGRSLLYYVQNREQTWLDVNRMSLHSGSTVRLFRETTDAWVNDPGDPHVLEDGSFILAGERTGWRHLYHFTSAGRLIGQITDGQWEVRGVKHVDEQAGQIYFTATRDSHIAHNLYRVSMDGGEPIRLTTEPGYHRINFSPDGRYFIDSWSRHTHPTRTRLRSADGQSLRWIDTNEVYEIEQFAWPEYRLFQIETSDGFQLEASLLLPPDFDPDRRYPVWFTTYAGPHAPTIRDTWIGRRRRDLVLADMGIVVFRCDPRSASGKGAVSAWTAYRRLGVSELSDITEAIEWLKRKPFVDPERIGMDGYSYGGFMTAYALTHSTLFTAGIAGAPVTDWRNYDAIYTERYMSTPQDNPDGYDTTSVVKAADQLHGRLLILHGVKDDNVHMQNTLQLIHAFQKADKDFQVMFYPKSRHGIHSKHFNRLNIEFIKESLAPESWPHEPATVQGR